MEGVNRVIRKSIKTQGSFSTKYAATKLICLTIRNFQERGQSVCEWFAACAQFASVVAAPRATMPVIMFDERFNLSV